MLSIDADFEIVKSNNVIFFRHCVKHGIELIGLEWNGMEWIGLDWIGLEWNGTEHVLIFSLRDKYICICVDVCTVYRHSK